MEAIRLREWEGRIVPLRQANEGDLLRETTHIVDETAAPDGFMLITKTNEVRNQELHFSVYKYSQKGKKDQWVIERKWAHPETWKTIRRIL